MTRIFAVALVVFVAVTSVAGLAATGLRIPTHDHNVQRPPKLSSGAPEACVDNITSAVEQVLAAGDAIVSAVAQCSNSTAECVADISQCTGDLTQAAFYVSMAVTACGARGSACVTDLLKITHDLADAVAQLSDAVSDCANSKTELQCIANVVDIGSFIEKIVVGVEACATDCRGNSTDV